MTRFAPLGLHRCRLIMAAVVGSWLMADVRPALAQPDASPLPSFDFRQAGAVAGWGEPHDVSHIEATRQGMAVHIDGPDPYVFGPAREYPAGTPLLLKIRLKSSEGGSFQVFYFGSGQGSSEKHSVRFAVGRGDWQEQTVPLPPLAPGFRLRLDPPGKRGVCLIESIRFTPRLTIAAPAWPKPAVREPVPGTLTIQSGALVLRQNPHEWGGFSVAAAGRQVATGHNRPLIGYLDPATARSATGPSVRWLDLAAVATVTTGLDPATKALSVEAQLRDPDGGQWRLRQVFRPGSPTAIDVHTECSIADRSYAPVRLARPPLRHRGARARAPGTWGRRPQPHRRRTVAARASQTSRQPSGEGLGDDHRRQGSKHGSGRHAVRRTQGPAAAPTDSEPTGLRPVGSTLQSVRATASATRPVSPSAPIRPPMPPGRWTSWPCSAPTPPWPTG